MTSHLLSSSWRACAQAAAMASMAGLLMTACGGGSGSGAPSALASAAPAASAAPTAAATFASRDGAVGTPVPIVSAAPGAAAEAGAEAPRPSSRLDCAP